MPAARVPADSLSRSLGVRAAAPRCILEVFFLWDLRGFMGALLQDVWESLVFFSGLGKNLNLRRADSSTHSLEHAGTACSTQSHTLFSHRLF